jgi:hypothetical protein
MFSEEDVQVVKWITLFMIAIVVGVTSYWIVVAFTEGESAKTCVEHGGIWQETTKNTTCTMPMREQSSQVLTPENE